MPGNYDGEGLNADGYVMIPEDHYIFRITKAEIGVTKAGDDKVSIDTEIVGGPYNLQPVNYHTVSFLKDKSRPGAGLSLKFLKAIGEPYEGNFRWDEKNWVGKKFKAYLQQEIQKEGKHAGKKFPRIDARTIEAATTETVAEEVPF